MPLFRFAFRAMACENELQLWMDDRAAAQRVAEIAVADVLRIEAKYSRYRGDSVTTRINAAAGGREVAIDGETSSLLDYADRCHRLSDGRFDVTSGVLRRVWDFRRTPPRLPSADELAEVTRLVNWSSVERSATTIRLPQPGMELDFGGIGKEYAADRASTLCLEQGCSHSLVNLGGDVRAMAPQSGVAPWRVGIRHPRAAGKLVATVELSRGAVATSGDYERFFDLNGKRYCHLLDARSGRPVQDWQSISVVAPLCIVAGTLSTVAMLLQSEAATFLAKQDLSYIAVDRGGQVRLHDAAAAAGGQRILIAHRSSRRCTRTAAAR